ATPRFDSHRRSGARHFRKYAALCESYGRNHSQISRTMGLDSRAVEDATRGRTPAVRFLVRGDSMKKTVQELSREVGASFEGDGSIEITGIAAPERASSGD